MSSSLHFVQTEIEINAPCENVWKVLTDFGQYSQWNGFMKNIKGQLSVGSELTEYMKFEFLPFIVIGKSYLIDVKPPHYFAWRGSFIHSLHRVGHGIHSFKLHEISAQKVKLIHREDYQGWIVPTTFQWIEKIARPHFAKMDRDLKNRVENLFSQESKIK